MSEPVEETGSASEEEVTPQQEVKREIIELVKLVALFLILFWGLKTFVVEGYEVQGQSMLPTLEDRERIFVFKLPYKMSQLPFLGGIDPIHEGDIIVFDSTIIDENGNKVKSNKRFIKRVIAAGPHRTSTNVVDAGQRDDVTPSPGAVKVVFDHGTVYVNNRRVEEAYIVPEERRSADRYGPVYLEPGEYYVLGDHRGVSKDSRSFGPIDEDQIIGKAVFCFWPPSKFGSL